MFEKAIELHNLDIGNSLTLSLDIAFIHRFLVRLLRYDHY